MRAFFVMVLFFAAFLLLVNSSMAGVDLTPDTPENAQAAEPIADPIITQPQAVPVEQNPVIVVQGAAEVPVTGGCVDPYNVQSGDTLSKIARYCSTTLAVLTQLNPQLANVDCIYPGQLINIINGSAVQLPGTCRVPALQVEAALPVEAAPIVVVPVTAAPIVSLPATCACINTSVPVSGLYPMLRSGSELQVEAIDFPPNTPVYIAIGPQAAGYTVISSGITDSNGSLATRLIVPAAPDSQTPWVVAVVTLNATPITVLSELFTIGP